MEKESKLAHQVNSPWGYRYMPLLSVAGKVLAPNSLLATGVCSLRTTAFQLFKEMGERQLQAPESSGQGIPHPFTMSYCN